MNKPPCLSLSPAAGTPGSRGIFPLALTLLGALVALGCTDSPPADGASPATTAPSSQASSQPSSQPGTASAPEAPLDPRQSFPFVDVTVSSGVDFTHDNGAAGRHHYLETMGPGAALFDADGDGDLDLYVVDGGPLPGTPPRRAVNRLYRNRGDGTFEDVTATAGADDDGYGMGVTVGDIDGDEDLDLYVLNYGPNVFYRNRGDGTFERFDSGAEDPTWSVSGAFFDADGDGDLDLYVANYLIYDAEKEKPCKAGTLEIYCSPEQFPPTADRLYRNDGGRFTDISAQAGVIRDGRGMGVTAGDLDGDGDQDLYVTNDRSHNLLYRNDGGRLSEVAAESGVGYGPTGLTEGGMGVAAADFTAAGQPAIFLTNFQKEPNRLYAPVGDGFYDDLTFRVGVGFPSSEMIGWGIGAFDLEGDGDVDLVVANGHVFENAEDFIPGSAWALPDHFYLNEGPGGGSARFAMQPFPGDPYSSRGLTWGDVDGDGDPDVVIAACGGPLKVWRNAAGAPDRFLVVRLRGAAPNTHAVGAQVRVETRGRTVYHEVTGGGSYASAHDDRLYLGVGDGGKAERLTVRWPDGTEETLTDVAGGREIIWRQGQGLGAERPLTPGTALADNTPTDDATGSAGAAASGGTP